jgi:Tol biopolymer transport system component
MDANAFVPSISADGERVAFETNADNVSAEDDNSVTNVFVRNAAANTTAFVSRASGAAGPAAEGASGDPAISGDGRYVAFESVADNLSAEDNDTYQNIFVRDLVANTTILVSRATGPAGAGADLASSNPAISADGRYVAFQSNANNLSDDDQNAVTDVFVRDLLANTTTLVSRAPGPGGAGGDAGSVNASISGDGKRVAFRSSANNLSNEDDDGVGNAFVRDLAAGTTVLVSRATGAAGTPADSGSFEPDLSPSGRYVAFLSLADNLSSDDDNAVYNLFVRDLDEATTSLASRASGPAGAGADGDSFSATVSDNARVAFSSGASNLSAQDNDAFQNIFVRDALGGTTELISRAPGAVGAAANQSSSFTSTSADGRYAPSSRRRPTWCPASCPSATSTAATCSASPPCRRPARPPRRRPRRPARRCRLRRRPPPGAAPPRLRSRPPNSSSTSASARPPSGA